MGGFGPLHEQWARRRQRTARPDTQLQDAVRPIAVEPTALVPDRLTSESRLRELFDTQFDFVWRSLRRLGVPELTVDDATQEVFLVVSRRLADIELGRERSFLFSTALRVASTARRAIARRGVHDDNEIDDLVDQAPGPEQLADRRRARAVLDQVLSTIDLDLRAVFVLYELEEMTMAEIAVTLELAPGTVASRLRRAREAFEVAATRLRGQA
jgi:RNA polymerase sigma-70 factor (ECF subfamily)